MKYNNYKLYAHTLFHTQKFEEVEDKDRFPNFNDHGEEDVIHAVKNQNSLMQSYGIHLKPLLPRERLSGLYLSPGCQQDQA